jgi:hypothetical protein
VSSLSSGGQGYAEGFCERFRFASEGVLRPINAERSVDAFWRTRENSSHKSKFFA